jgi:single-strand DNA-binding protein
MITVTVIGRLGSDPEVKQINDKTLCNLRVASKEFSTTEWVNVTAFGKDAEFCGEYLHKGDAVAISGRLQTRKYTGKDGIERYITEVVANRVEGIGSKGGADAEERPF